MISCFGAKKMKTIKNQKPISLDVHLKYRCPNSDCSNEHWLSLRESKTKRFKVVCSCSTIFEPAQIQKIKIQYKPQKLTKKLAEIPEVLLKQVSDILVSYGFTKQEAENKVKKAYKKHITDDIKILIKQSLLEENDNG